MSEEYIILFYINNDNVFCFSLKTNLNEQNNVFNQKIITNDML